MLTIRRAITSPLAPLLVVGGVHMVVIEVVVVPVHGDRPCLVRRVHSRHDSQELVVKLSSLELLEVGAVEVIAEIGVDVVEERNAVAVRSLQHRGRLLHLVRRSLFLRWVSHGRIWLLVAACLRRVLISVCRSSLWLLVRRLTIGRLLRLLLLLLLLSLLSSCQRWVRLLLRSCLHPRRGMSGMTLHARRSWGWHKLISHGMVMIACHGSS
mmetsp:Transcript_2114/g.4848  ORF Transcript_2114/g.4848 Transcript_2114/m.4848 type:complete len:211 (-) Transcript_2114:450-1082(-)